MAIGNNESRAIGVLETRVTGLESSISGLAGEIRIIASKIDSRSQTQWSTILSFIVVVIGLVTGFYTFVFTPLFQTIGELHTTDLQIQNNYETRNDADKNQQLNQVLIEKITQTLDKMVDTTVSKAESNERWDAFKQLYDSNRASGLDRLKRIEDDINGIQSSVVPRGEHAQKWASYDNQLVALQREIDDTNKRLGDTFNLRDVISDLRERLNKIEGVDKGPITR